MNFRYRILSLGLVTMMVISLSSSSTAQVRPSKTYGTMQFLTKADMDLFVPNALRGSETAYTADTHIDYYYDFVLSMWVEKSNTDTDDQTLSLTGNDLTISEGNTVTLPITADTDDQTLSLTGNDLTISEGNTVTLPITADTDDQTLSLTGNDLTISEGNTVTLPITADTDDQTLSISGLDLTISEGNTITLPDSSGLWSEASGTNIFRPSKAAVGSASDVDNMVLHDFGIFDVDGTGHTSVIIELESNSTASIGAINTLGNGGFNLESVGPGVAGTFMGSPIAGQARLQAIGGNLILEGGLISSQIKLGINGDRYTELQSDGSWQHYGKYKDSDGDVNDGSLVMGSHPDGTLDWKQENELDIDYNDDRNSSNIFDGLRTVWYRAGDGDEVNLDGNRITIDVLETVNLRFRLNRNVNTFDLRKGKNNEPWHVAGGWTGTNTIPPWASTITKIDFVNDWIYYDVYRGGNPTLNWEVELFNPYTRYYNSNIEDELLLPVMAKGAFLNGAAVDFTTQSHVVRKQDGTYFMIVNVHNSNGTKVFYKATSVDGLDWILDTTPLYNNTTLGGGTTTHTCEQLMRVPNTDPDYAGKYVAFWFVDNHDFGGYAIFNEDLSIHVPLTLMNTNPANIYSMDRPRIKCISYFKNEWRFILYDLKSPASAREIVEFVFPNGLKNILDGTASTTKKIAIELSQTDVNSLDLSEGLYDPYQLLVQGGDLYMIGGLTQYKYGSFTRGRRFNMIYKLDGNDDWNVYRDPYMFCPWWDMSTGYDPTLINIENRASYQKIFKLNNGTWMSMQTIGGPGSNNYQTFLVEIVTDNAGRSLVLDQLGSHSISGATTIFFDAPFDTAPIVTPTVIDGVVGIPIVSAIDKYSFTMNVYDTGGSAINATINYVAQMN